jgi:hypothetical protein
MPKLTASDFLGPINLGLTPKDLLKELNDVFPEASPEYNETIEQLRWRGGQRSVVRWIQSRLNKDTDDD